MEFIENKENSSQKLTTLKPIVTMDDSLVLRENINLSNQNSMGASYEWMNMLSEEQNNHSAFLLSNNGPSTN